MCIPKSKINKKSHFKCGLKVFKQFWKFVIIKYRWKIRLKLIVSFVLICIPLVYVIALKNRNCDNFQIIPTIVWWTSNFPGPRHELIQCSSDIKCLVKNRHKEELFDNVQAYIFYGTDVSFTDLPLPRNNKVWALYHEESPRNQELLMHEEILSLFNYSATFSRFSNLAFPLQYLEDINDITNQKFYVETKEKNRLLKDIAPVMYLQSDCKTSTERDEYVKELMENIEIDSFGICLNNRDIPNKFKVDYLNNFNDEEFLSFIAKYKFVIAIENAVCQDYITEKLWRPLKVGSVPIYFGSPSVKDWLPNNDSAILIEKFETPKKLADYLKMLIENDDLYERHLEHKLQKKISNKRLINEFKTKAWVSDTLKVIQNYECLICKGLFKNIVNSKVTKSHYDCPKPISALTLESNPKNDWVKSWITSKNEAKKIRDQMNNE